jgi:hypothetical protein
MLNVLGAAVGIYLDTELHSLFLKESFRFVTKHKIQYDKMFSAEVFKSCLSTKIA